MASALSNGIILAKSTHLIGGGEKQTLLLAQGLATSKQVLIPTNPGSLLINFIPEGVKYECIDLGQEADRRWPIIAMRFKLAKLQKKILPKLKMWFSQGYGVIVCQSINEKLVFSGPAKLLGFQVVWLDFQSLVPWLPRNPLFSKLKETSEYVDKILVTSDYLKNKHKNLGLGQINVIPSGIILPLKTNPKKTEETDQVTIGIVSRLHREKGIDVFLKALSRLPVSTRAIIVGAGPEKENLTALALKLGISQRVKFVGFVQDPGGYFQMFDIFCQPSLRDNTPLTIIEAMAYGVPVVATNVGGIPELIGQAGLIVSPEDPKELVEAMERLVGNKSLREAMINLGIKRAQDFSIDKMAQKFNDQLSA